MNWNKVMEFAKNAIKAIYILIFIIFGIKILCFLIMFSFVPYRPFSLFDQPDWNPIATIVGSIITGLITWFAVFKTSELDKKARKYEYKNKFYQDKLLELNNSIGFIECLNDRGFNQDIKTSFCLDEQFLDVFEKQIYEFKKILNYLILLKPNSYLNDFKKDVLPSLEAFFSFLKNNPNKKFMNGECKELFKEYVKSENNKDLQDKIFKNIDYTDKNKEIAKIKQIIQEELKLEDK